MGASREHFIERYGGIRIGESDEHLLERCRRIDDIRDRIESGTFSVDDIALLNELLGTSDEEFLEALNDLREPRRFLPDTRYVYFAQVPAPPHFIKIGVADDVKRRLAEHRRQLGTSLVLLGVIAWVNQAGPHREDTGHIAERLIHRRFARERVADPSKHGLASAELFRPSKRLLTFIGAYTTQDIISAPLARLGRGPRGRPALPVAMDPGQREYG